ncbi:MAG: hypothetical protein LC798_18225 [Chloroflexi bacterium]|nr:hypothetical protein [Chloroflexota bacterium]
MRGLGIVLGLIGLAFVVAGGFAFFKVQEGTASLKGLQAAQGVELAYNEDGHLVRPWRARRRAGDHGPPHRRLGIPGRGSR